MQNNERISFNETNQFAVDQVVRNNSLTSKGYLQNEKKIIRLGQLTIFVANNQPTSLKKVYSQIYPCNIKQHNFF